jgi:NAD-dependent deacetylase
MNQIEELNKLINSSNNIVFFGGAGVSTESGIPDFRSVDGLYHLKYAYPPEQILSRSFFQKKTEEFYRFYYDKMIYQNAAPNVTHKKLAELEAAGKLKAVITQNIDGLHQAAGSKNVIELHGSIHKNHCTSCGTFYTLDDVLNKAPLPRCSCDGIIKPEVVLYEEPLKDRNIQAAIKAISEADMLIIGGTSLSVYPAASFIDYYTGNKLILINKSATPLDSKADLLLSLPLGEVMSALLV